MISFANPVFLWGLSTLAIPLAIHLLSRKEDRVIYIGSLRHLTESNTKQSLNIRLNELLLLALRSLLIILLVFYVSGLQWQSSSLSPKKWVLLEKGLDKNLQIQQVVDSLLNGGYEPHYLAPGFPLLRDSNEVREIKTYQSLIESLKFENLTNAIAFTYNYQKFFSGRRVSLPATIQWITVETIPIDFVLQAVRTRSDSLQVRIGHSNSEAMYFETVKTKALTGDLFFKMPFHPADSIAISSPDSLVVLIVSDPVFGYDRKIIKAAIESLREFVPSKLKLIELSGLSNSIDSCDWLFWFSHRPIPPGSFRNRVILDENPSLSLFQKLGNGNWQLTSRLNADMALEENLSIQLAKMFFPSRETIDLNDRRALSEKMSWSETGAREDAIAQSRIINRQDSSLLLLILMVLFIERIISNKRGQ